MTKVMLSHERLGVGFPKLITCHQDVSFYFKQGLKRLSVEHPNFEPTQAFFADAVGVSRTSLSRSIIMNGESGSRRVRILVACVIGLRPSEMWTWLDDRELLLDDHDYFKFDVPEFQRWFRR